MADDQDASGATPEKSALNLATKTDLSAVKGSVTKLENTLGRKINEIEQGGETILQRVGDLDGRIESLRERLEAVPENNAVVEQLGERVGAMEELTAGIQTTLDDKLPKIDARLGWIKFLAWSIVVVFFIGVAHVLVSQFLFRGVAPSVVGASVDASTDIGAGAIGADTTDLGVKGISIAVGTQAKSPEERNLKIIYNEEIGKWPEVTEQVANLFNAPEELYERLNRIEAKTSATHDAVGAVGDALTKDHACLQASIYEAGLASAVLTDSLARIQTSLEAQLKKLREASKKEK